MNILEALVQLRDDLKTWVTNNLNYKLNKNLGVGEQGKILSVDKDGNVKPVELSGLEIGGSDSPAFTGTPTAPTVDVDSYDPSQDNVIATLKFVMDAVAAGGGSLYSQIPIPLSTWASDTTYPDFPYRATVPMEGVTSSTFGWLIFNDDEFAITCKSNPETGSGCVYIYATQIPTAMQYFNFWSIPTTSMRGAEIAIAIAPINVIYDPQDVFNPDGMAVDYIAADGTVTRLANNEWVYTPTRALTANDKYVTVSATNPNISATVKQRIYVVVGQSLINATNKRTSGYSSDDNLDLIIGRVVRNDDDYYYVNGVDSYAYENCTNIVTVTMPEQVLSVGEGAFKGCSSMTTVNYPTGTNINIIEPYTFSGCSSLTNINIDTDIVAIGAHGLEGTGYTYYDVPLTITEVSEYMLASCVKLTEIKTRDHITAIKSNAFGNNLALKKAYLSKNENSFSIAADAFAGCTQKFDIYVSWDEGVVANAPWGAVNATIHYGYKNFPSENNYPNDNNFPIDM